jgi:hypothetical protein
MVRRKPSVMIKPHPTIQHVQLHSSPRTSPSTVDTNAISSTMRAPNPRPSAMAARTASALMRPLWPGNEASDKPSGLEATIHRWGVVARAPTLA